MPPHLQWYPYSMANGHHPTHSPGSPKTARSPLPTKTIFDKTNPPVDRSIAKTTTHGRNRAFPRITLAHDRVTFDRPLQLPALKGDNGADPSTECRGHPC